MIEIKIRFDPDQPFEEAEVITDPKTFYWSSQSYKNYARYMLFMNEIKYVIRETYYYLKEEKSND